MRHAAILLAGLALGWVAHGAWTGWHFIMVAARNFR